MHGIAIPYFGCCIKCRKHFCLYIDKVFSQYHYYGPQKITLHEWENVKKIALSKENQKECIITFFIQIDDWINNDVNKNDYFWILGI